MELLPSHVITVVFGEKSRDLLDLREDKRKGLQKGYSVI